MIILFVLFCNSKLFFLCGSQTKQQSIPTFGNGFLVTSRYALTTSVVSTHSQLCLSGLFPHLCTNLMYKRHKLLMENNFLLQVYMVFGSLLHCVKLGSARPCIVRLPLEIFFSVKFLVRKKASNVNTFKYL